MEVTVRSGSGKATEWQLTPEGATEIEQIRQRQGWETIVPGTLNLVAPGFEKDVPCPVTVNGQPAVIVKWLGDVAEVMAPVRLRDALGLQDGDRVTLEAQTPSEEHTGALEEPCDAERHNRDAERHNPWVVLAPGHSLGKWDQLPPGTVVAVNKALLTARRKGWEVNYLCCHDGPKGLDDWSERTPVLWTQERHQDWADKKGIPIETYPDHAGKFQTALLPKGVQHYKRSLFTAVAIAFHRGASEVSVLGCDMQGAGYADGTDRKNRDEKGWETRWDGKHGERNEMNARFEAFRQAGKKIQILHPNGWSKT